MSFLEHTDEFCTICGFPLDKKFPLDFPDDWKFCCSCLKWAEFITYEQNIKYNIDSHRKGSTLNEIYNKITLVG